MTETRPEGKRPTGGWLQNSRRKGNKFCNPLPTEVGTLRLILKAMPLYIRNHEQRTPAEPLGPFPTDVSRFATAPSTGLRVTWFGHSSTLLEIDGIRILLDPVWEERASPRQWFGPRRFFAPTLALETLPLLDAILISHDHYDHMGEMTLRRLADSACAADAQWITALGVGSLLRAWNVPANHITELDWTQAVVVKGRGGAELKVTAVPSRHFSGRSLLRRFETLWAAYVLKGPQHSVYFGADSGWWDGFTEIGENFGPFDLTMLEIGAYNDLWKDIHLGPDNALRAFQAIGHAGLLMPIHWGLFDLALHGWRQPIERLTEIAAAAGVPLWSPRPGLPTDVDPGSPLLDGWWRPSRKTIESVIQRR